MHASPFHNWREITQSKERFQTMVAMLVEFDERTARFRRFGDPEQHFFRKAIAIADPDELRIFLKQSRGYLFYVVTEIRTPCGFCATSWVHQDGVQIERDQLTGEPDHPVHSIPCLSDFYRNHGEDIPDDIEEVTMSDSTLDLMFSEVNWKRPPFVA